MRYIYIYIYIYIYKCWFTKKFTYILTYDNFDKYKLREINDHAYKNIEIIILLVSVAV